MEKEIILLVDDEKDLVKIVKNRLEAAGYGVLVAYDGAQALEKVKERPNLVLLDIMMPGLDGFEVLRRLRNNKNTREIPVIMFTAAGESRSIFEAQGLGVTDYIIKPFEPEKLLSLIKRCIL